MTCLESKKANFGFNRHLLFYFYFCRFPISFHAQDHKEDKNGIPSSERNPKLSELNNFMILISALKKKIQLNIQKDRLKE